MRRMEHMEPIATFTTTLGTIVIDAFDQSSHGTITMTNVPRVFDAADLIRAAVDGARGTSHVAPREYMGLDDDDAEGW